MAKRKPMVVKGYTRTAGYYGRFRGRRTGGGFGGELKFLDTGSSTLFTTAGAVNPNFVVIPQGVGESERIGRKVTIKSIYLKGVIVHNPVTVNSAANTCRIMIIQDKQANGAVFAVTDVLETASYLAHRKLENINRFKILKDTTFSINSNSSDGSAPGEAQRPFTYYTRCNIPIEYDTTASTGAIATQRSNSIALLMIADTGTVTTFSYNCRVRYSDNS